MSFDIKRKPLRPSHPRHSQHQKFLEQLKAQAAKRHWVRNFAAMSFFAAFLFLYFNAAVATDQDHLTWVYQERSEIQKIRINSLARSAVLPVEAEQPQTDQIAEFLREKNSPLADYAGLIARMPHWKLILGIAQAESNLCKRTDKNNCWGIGPGGPWTYEEIEDSLYHVNYLIQRYQALGMDMERPETMVRTYVGFQNPNWVAAIYDVFSELEERGL